MKAPYTCPSQQRVEVSRRFVGMFRDNFHVDDNGGPPDAGLQAELQRGVP